MVSLSLTDSVTCQGVLSFPHTDKGLVVTKHLFSYPFVRSQRQLTAKHQKQISTGSD